MKLFAFAASLRQDSVNKKLIARAAALATAQGAEVTLVDFRDLLCPWYDDDVKVSEGFPAGAELLRSLLEEHDGMLVSTPEYNHCIPGALKNTMDWVSRYRPSQPFAGANVYVLSASPSLTGGNRAAWRMRHPLAVMGAHVFPGMFSLANAGSNFNEDGAIKDAALDARLSGELGAFIQHVSKLNG